MILTHHGTYRLSDVKSPDQSYPIRLYPWRTQGLAPSITGLVQCRENHRAERRGKGTASRAPVPTCQSLASARITAHFGRLESITSFFGIPIEPFCKPRWRGLLGDRSQEQLATTIRVAFDSTYL